MDKVVLIRSLREKQAAAIEIMNEESKELEFFNNFYKKYSLNGINNMLKVDHTELMLAYILSNIISDDRERAFSCIYEQVESIRNLIDSCSESGIKIILTILEGLKKDNSLSEVKLLFNDDNIKRGKYNLKKMPSNDYLSSKNIEALYDIQEYTGSNISNLISLYENAENAVTNALCIISDLKSLREDSERFNKTLDDFIAKSKDKKFFSNMFGKAFDTSDIDKDFDEIRKHYNMLLEKERNKKRTAQRELNTYCSLQEKIVNLLAKEEITTIEKLLSKVTDKDIRMKVLKLVYEHNQEYYEKLLFEYNELSKNSLIHYQTILKEYNLEDVEIETIMNNSVEDVKSMLQRMKKINITDQIISKTILQITDIKIFNSILELVESGILSTKLLIQNPIIFDSASKEYENLMLNLKLFKELNFNPYNLFNNQDILIKEPQLIGKSIEILKKYKFTKGFKKHVDYSFLALPNLMSILDQMLELGLEKFLEEDLSIINYYKNLNRIKIVRELNIPIDSKAELIELLTTDKFIVPDELIPKYIQNVSHDEINQFVENSSIEADINVLKQYESTSRTYNINGVLVSINRVKRNYSEFNKNALNGNRLLYSILNDSHLTKSSYKTIKETLTESLTYS